MFLGKSMFRKRAERQRPEEEDPTSEDLNIVSELDQKLQPGNRIEHRIDAHDEISPVLSEREKKALERVFNKAMQREEEEKRREKGIIAKLKLILSQIQK